MARTVNNEQNSWESPGFTLPEPLITVLHFPEIMSRIEQNCTLFTTLCRTVKNREDNADGVGAGCLSVITEGLLTVLYINYSSAQLIMPTSAIKNVYPGWQEAWRPPLGTLAGTTGQDPDPTRPLREEHSGYRFTRVLH